MIVDIPCRRPENNPDDWFIGKDGKQYADDEIVTDEQVDAYLAEGHDAYGPEWDEPAKRRHARAKLEDKAIRAALQRRRHAREMCHLECPIRLTCLGENLELPYGTAGGYYEEERRQIVTLRDARERRRAVPAEE